MNQNIVRLNGGKLHQPIMKVRIYEKADKFAVGQRGNKSAKFVEAADNTNLYFAIYVNEDGKRYYETIPLNVVVKRLKRHDTAVPQTKTVEEKGEVHELRLLFHLSPNDLVYIPTEEEKDSISHVNYSNLNKEQKKRLWIVNDFSSTIYFRPYSFAKSIAPKEVDLYCNKDKNKLQGSYDYKTASFEGKQIKEVCIKLTVDRLGNIKPF